MLFNSYPFVFAFFPLTLAVYYAAGGRSKTAALLWLTLTSLFFYAWWELWALPVLIGSIGFNYLISRTMTRPRLIVAVTLNLLALAFFKYAGFVVENLAPAFTALGLPPPAPPRIPLPIGISFFTFTQIAYLVDRYRRRAGGRGILDYTLFVTYFPHLIAGPILHHGQMMPQFASSRIFRFEIERLEKGLTLFAIGLSKKLLIADRMAPLADQIFDAGGAGSGAGAIQAWVGVLAYTLQIYFDFSGYSDMALGISRCFGIELPINFHSPYRATSIIEFWRRWHISLSAFLRDYLYIPLGGGRRGKVRRYLNLMITMVLGGLWHGASWTFLIWGAIHGFLLLLNHLWRDLFGEKRRLPGGPVIGAALTFFFVMLAWVFFRAEDLATALRVLGALFGSAGAGSFALDANSAVLLGLALAVAWFGVPSHEIPAERRRIAFAAGVGLGLSLLSMNEVSPFLYFRF